MFTRNAKITESSIYQPPPLPLPVDNPTILKMIANIRERMINEYEKNPQLYINADITDIRDEDFRIRRCIYGCKLNEDAAYEMLRNTLEWRKTIGFEGASPTRFPIEFYKIAAIFEYMPDREGTPLLYMRIKLHKRIESILDGVKKFMIYNFDLIDQKVRNERGWAIIFDVSGATLANADLSLLYFFITTLNEHFSWSLRYIVIYELPWILEKCFKLALLMIAEEARPLIRLYNKNNITELIAKENLPDFMNGECKRNYRTVPEGAKTAEEIGALELGMKPDEVKKLIKLFDKHLNV